MPPREWTFRIQDILDAMEKIQRFTAGTSLEVFERDEKLIDAVVHNLTVIGEAANHVERDHVQGSGDSLATDDRPAQLLGPRVLEPAACRDLGHDSERPAAAGRAAAPASFRRAVVAPGQVLVTAARSHSHAAATFSEPPQGPSPSVQSNASSVGVSTPRNRGGTSS